MKKYVKPELEQVEFATEVVTAEAGTRPGASVQVDGD